MNPDRPSIWLKIYLARVQSGCSHNDAVVNANSSIDFVLDAFKEQVRIAIINEEYNRNGE